MSIRHEHAKKIANEMIEWYFNNHAESFNKISNNSPKLSKQTWTNLLVEAISSFNQGLEEYIDHDNRRASVDVEDIIDIVGRDAFKTIAFLVVAQGTRRPIDVWGQASTIYTQAMSLITNPSPQTQKQLHDASTQLQNLSKTEGLDPNTAKNIAGLGAELMQEADKMTATSGGGQIGQGGMSERGMPTGLTIQGKKKYRTWVAE